LTKDYPIDLGAILGEFRLLVAVSGILFGFLLNVSSFRRVEVEEEQTILILALSFAAVAILTFLLPSVYHHSRSFPVTEEEAKKIYFRSHRFALWGLIALITAIYFSLIMALYVQINRASYILATAILAVPAVLFIARKFRLPPSRKPKSTDDLRE